MAQETASITFNVIDEASAKIKDIADNVVFLNKKLEETSKGSQEAFKPFNEAANRVNQQVRETQQQATTLGSAIRTAAEQGTRALNALGLGLGPVSRQLGQAATFGKEFSLALGLAGRAAGGFVAAGAGVAAGLYGISRAFTDAYQKAENFRRISGIMDQGMIDRMTKARELVGMETEQAQQSILRLNQQIRDLRRGAASELAQQARILGPEWSRKINELSVAIRTGKMSIDEAREALLDWLGEIKDPEAQRYAAQLFHVDPIEIVRRKEIRDYQRQIIGQTAELTAKQKELADATNKVTIAFGNLKTSIWEAIGPATLNLLADMMNSLTNLGTTLQKHEWWRLNPFDPRNLPQNQPKPEGRQHGGPVSAGVPYLVGEAGPEIFMPSGAGQVGSAGTLREMTRLEHESNVYARETRDILAWMRQQMEQGGWGGMGGGLGGGAGGAGGGGGGLPVGGFAGGGGGRRTGSPWFGGRAGRAPGTGADAAAAGVDLSGKPIDPNTLAQVQAMAERGDRQGIFNFIRSQGYNVDSNWCGDFTSAIVRASGGTPPRGSPVASTWLNWGAHVDPANVRAGDVAVSRVGTYGGMQGVPLRPGQAGGHVGVVGSGGYDPKTNRFQMIDTHGRPYWRNAGPMEFRRGGTSGGMGAGDGEEPTSGAGRTSEGIAGQRARLVAEIDRNPQLRADIANVIGHETDNPTGATAVLESLFNRTLRKGSTLAQELRSGFYGPVNRGEVRLGGRASAWATGQFDRAFHNVAGGSDLIGGRDDQGMRHEIHGPGAIKVGGEWFGYMGARSRAWAARRPQEQRAADGVPMPVPRPGDRPSRLDVHVAAPKGTKVKADGGDVFKDVKVKQTAQMAPSNVSPDEE